MKIDRIRLYSVPPRWLFLAIDTDQGITGWGEPIVEGRTETMVAAVNELAEYIIDRDPRQINDIWQLLYRGGFYRGGPVLMSALSGIDQALWDIKGKALNQPVFELLGGKCREKMAMYSWIGGDEAENAIEEIEHRLEFGDRVFKLNVAGRLDRLHSTKTIDNVVEYFSAIRHKFGNSIDFAIDFHGRVSLTMASILLRELECVHPLFVEEPVLPEHSDCLSGLSQRTSIPLATGERLYSRFDCRNILASGGVSILQPDPSHAGGITETLKIATMADAYDVSIAPHCPLGPLALASCLTIDFVSHNAVIQESSLMIHYNVGHSPLSYITNKSDFTIKSGFMEPLRNPGLGVEIDEKAVVEASRMAPRWRNPIWRQTDGAIAEW